MMRRYLDGASDYRGMFLDEARLAARLNHPNVVQTNEVDARSTASTSSRWSTSTGSRSTASCTAPRSRRTAARAAPAASSPTRSRAAPRARARDYDGSPLGVVHRDVSPHNIFVTYDGAGEGRRLRHREGGDRGVAETRAGVLKGKVAYMAPEQAQRRDVDRRADIFAMGVVLWEVVFDRPLWEGFDHRTVMHRLTTGDIPRPTRSRAGSTSSTRSSCARRPRRSATTAFRRRSRCNKR